MSRPAAIAVAALDLRVTLRGRWWSIAVALGLACAATAAIWAAVGEMGREAARLHGGALNLLLLGGVAVAIGLGSSAINRDAEGGFLGLMEAAGARRPAIGLGRALSRIGALLLVLAAWTVGVQVASVAIGRGLDGPLALLSLATAATCVLVLLVCAAASTLVGPRTAGVLGAMSFATVQALTNLEAAANQRLIGTVWRDVSDAVSAALPRQLHTRLSADLVNAGDGGPAGQRFEVNSSFATIEPATWATVAVCALWLLALLAAVVNGMRNREL